MHQMQHPDATSEPLDLGNYNLSHAVGDTTCIHTGNASCIARHTCNPMATVQRAGMVRGVKISGAQGHVHTGSEWWFKMKVMYCIEEQDRYNY